MVALDLLLVVVVVMVLLLVVVVVMVLLLVVVVVMVLLLVQVSILSLLFSFRLRSIHESVGRGRRVTHLSHLTQMMMMMMMMMMRIDQENRTTSVHPWWCIQRSGAPSTGRGESRCSCPCCPV